MKRNQVALKHGFKSGLEDGLSDFLTTNGKKFGYETEKIKFTQPAMNRTYTPDFVITKTNGETVYLETKGRWTKIDRERFDWIFDQHPGIDIRFVFQTPNAKLYKGSKTTYAQYCDKKGWKWSKKVIPDEWLDECSSI